ncbi:hypothetical protein RFI_16214 [Reticulomyxa filosa]|uniref:Uncharacterized protein n=1 Tax=Reticulomyxa filosa TaxID=46433 RepID=X6N5H4_RETFI|nr:hypothetical protein RFI_16214 [Reticulomyxa filosa]|eukprot:ETO20989.1 hypothetical protein RFI_16214 [Reticulomyxa filosa]
MLGLKFEEVCNKTLDDFEGTDTEKKVQLDFYQQRQMVLLQEVHFFLYKNMPYKSFNLILLTMTSVVFFSKILNKNDTKTEKRGDSVEEMMSKEEEKIQKSIFEQEHETRRLALKIGGYSKNSETKEAEKLETELQCRQLHNMRTMDRTRQLEEYLKQEQETKMTESTKLQNENKQKWKETEMEQKVQRQKLMQKRAQDMWDKAEEMYQSGQQLNHQRNQTVEQIEHRYHQELQRHHHKVEELVLHTQQTQNVRKQKHSHNHQQFRELLADQEQYKHHALSEKQKLEQAKIQKFEVEKMKRYLAKRQAKKESMKSIYFPTELQQERLSRMEADQNRAEKNRRLTLARRMEEGKLKVELFKNFFWLLSQNLETMKSLFYFVYLLSLLF